jgi:hypothetical protein
MKNFAYCKHIVKEAADAFYNYDYKEEKPKQLIIGGEKFSHRDLLAMRDDIERFIIFTCYTTRLDTPLKYVFFAMQILHIEGRDLTDVKGSLSEPFDFSPLMNSFKTHINNAEQEQRENDGELSEPNGYILKNERKDTYLCEEIKTMKDFWIKTSKTILNASVDLSPIVFITKAAAERYLSAIIPKDDVIIIPVFVDKNKQINLLK